MAVRMRRFGKTGKCGKEEVGDFWQEGNAVGDAAVGNGEGIRDRPEMVGEAGRRVTGK